MLYAEPASCRLDRRERVFVIISLTKQNQEDKKDNFWHFPCIRQFLVTLLCMLICLSAKLQGRPIRRMFSLYLDVCIVSK